MFWTRLHQFDQQVTLAINRWSTPVTDPLWQFFSNIPVWIPMYVLVVALLNTKIAPITRYIKPCFISAF